MQKIFRIILPLVGIILTIHSCRRLPESYIPEMQSSIAYGQFHQQAIQRLLSEPLNLKIDTAWIKP